MSISPFTFSWHLYLKLVNYKFTYLCLNRIYLKLVPIILQVVIQMSSYHLLKTSLFPQKHVSASGSSCSS